MTEPVPSLRPRPVRTMVDMGMEMEGMAMATSGRAEDAMPGMAMDEDRPLPGMGAGHGPVVGRHDPDDHGPGNTSVPTLLRSRLGEPGIGLADVGHRMLVYTDLGRLDADFDARPVDREIELHLTGDMERYIWGFDGRKFSETDRPIRFRHGERLRLVMINDTMMEHPIHLHGMWMELENGHGDRIPRKHTVSVKPAERLSVLVPVDAPGRWALHCHLLYHMDVGMFRVVHVSQEAGTMFERPILPVLLLSTVLGGGSAPARTESGPAGTPAGWPPPIHDAQVDGFVLFDQLECREADGPDTLRWDMVSWIGGDSGRLWIESEGQTLIEGGEGEIERLDVLFGRLVSPFWDFQAGPGYRGPGGRDRMPTCA